LANKLIIYHAVVAAFLWPIAFSLPSSFKAASDVKYTLGVSMISMWLFRVALGYVVATKSISLFGLNIPGLGLGVFGVWLAMTVDWLFRAILFIIRYLNGRWLTKYKD
jgi:Na+-driven multidrug efflux pump